MKTWLRSRPWRRMKAFCAPIAMMREAPMKNPEMAADSVSGNMVKKASTCWLVPRVRLVLAAGSRRLAPAHPGPALATLLTLLEMATGEKVPGAAGAKRSVMSGWPTSRQSSQRAKCSGFITTGMRSWIGAMSALAGQVRMAAVSISEPSAEFQVSISPPKATMPPPLGDPEGLALLVPSRRHS